MGQRQWVVDYLQSGSMEAVLQLPAKQQVFLACYRRATADVHTVVINHKAGCKSQKAGLDDRLRSSLGSIKNAVLTYNHTSTPCRHDSMLRYKPCWCTCILAYLPSLTPLSLVSRSHAWDLQVSRIATYQENWHLKHTSIQLRCQVSSKKALIFCWIPLSRVVNKIHENNNHIHRQLILL